MGRSPGPPGWEDNRFEHISEFATADLGYIVEIHRARAKLGGAAERAPFALLITTIFRREDGVVDRPSSRRSHKRPRPIESVGEQ